MIALTSIDEITQIIRRNEARDPNFYADPDAPSAASLISKDLSAHLLAIYGIYSAYRMVNDVREDREPLPPESPIDKLT